MTHRSNLYPLLLHTLSLCCEESSFGWSTLIAVGHSLSLLLRSRKKEKSPSPLIHQNSTCQAQAQENCHQFLFFTPPFPILFVFCSTNICHVPRSQGGALICDSATFSITHSTLCKPPEHERTEEVTTAVHQWLTWWLHNKIQHPSATLMPTMGCGNLHPCPLPLNTYIPAETLLSVMFVPDGGGASSNRGVYK